MNANTSTGEPPFFSFLRGAMRKPRIPCKRHRNTTPVTEIHAKCVVRDAHTLCEGNFLFNTRNIHSTPIAVQLESLPQALQWYQSSLYWSRRFAEYAPDSAKALHFFHRARHECAVAHSYPQRRKRIDTGQKLIPSAYVHAICQPQRPDAISRIIIILTAYYGLTSRITVMTLVSLCMTMWFSSPLASS